MKRDIKTLDMKHHPITKVRVNKVEAETDITSTKPSTSTDSVKRQKFDCYINGLISYPNKLVGKKNTVRINGADINSLIDTGSQVSIISHNLYSELFNYLTIKPLEKLLNLQGITGNSLDYMGYVELYVTPGEKLAGIPFDAGVQCYCGQRQGQDPQNTW